MTTDQGRPGKLQRRWRGLLSTRARRQLEPPRAALADRALVERTGSFRRQFDSLVEPDQPDPPPPRTAPAAAGPPESTRPPLPPRRGVSAWLLLPPALTLAVGLALGFTLGSTQVSRPRAGAAAAPTSPAPSTRLVPTPSTRVIVRHYASPACLETAKRGDQLIDLLIRNQRDQVEDRLILYTVAAQQCRKDASPTP
jgi:hypothetical protein